MSYATLGERLSVGVKARVLCNYLLTGDEYWALLGSDTVAEVADKLRRSEGYGERLRTLPQEVHRYDLEGALRMTLPEQAARFLIHLSNQHSAFFRACFSWHESENLKSIFRHIHAGRDDRDSLRARLYLILGSSVSYENLLACNDFRATLDVLRGTLWQRVVDEPLKRLISGEEKSLFPLETALDSHTDYMLQRNLRKQDTELRNQLLRIFGLRADLMNIYTLYRAKTYYDLSAEEIFAILPPARWRLSLRFLREAVRVSDTAVLTELLRSQYPGYVDILDGVVNESEGHLMMERNIKRRVLASAERVFRSGAPGFHTVMGYFVMKEYEIDDLIHIVEDVRYDYDRRTAAKYLIREIFTGGETEWR